MNDERLLQQAIDRATIPTYISSKAELVEYYKDTYGAKGWTSHIAADLAGTSDKSSKEYLAAIRHFQGDRLAREGRDTSRYEKLGATLPPIRRDLKGDSITLTVTGTQEGHRQRNISVTMSGPDAYSFVNNPNWYDFWQEYGVDGDMFEDGEYAVSVGSVAAY